MTKLQIPLDEQLKRRTEKKAEKYGFSSLQELIRVFLAQFDRGVIHPNFRVLHNVEYIDPEYEKELIAATQEIDRAVKDGTARFAHSADELIDMLEEDIRKGKNGHE